MRLVEAIREKYIALYDKYLKQNIFKEDYVMKNVKEMKKEAKEKAVEVKNFIAENAGLIIGGVAFAGVTIGCIAYGKHTSKKYETMWRKAKQAYENGQLDYDFGPYKIAKFFEPTGEFLGEIPMHGESVKAFLDLK